MKIHLIALGGSIMHNLAIELQRKGHEVAGSDDEIYDPSRTRLERHGLLPEVMGWHPERHIRPDLEAVILGMHARPDNPELRRAQELGLRIYSFPEFIYEHSRDKLRVVVGGSHGKTSTTAMIMHALKHWDRDFDYMVGAQLEGFDLMVRLSDAPIIVLEGDEYLSSPIDRRPKFLHYHPQLAILTGIAWDHINVFPTFEGYVDQFRQFIQGMDAAGKLYYYANDSHLRNLLWEGSHRCTTHGYEAPYHRVVDGRVELLAPQGIFPLHIFGQHNLENLRAAWWVCKELGLSDLEFLEAMTHFQGAAKRLQHLGGNAGCDIYLDYAHAPSKAKATVEAVRGLHPQRKLAACLELHTFSSLNRNFHPQYRHTLQAADRALVYYSEHTLGMKKLPHFSPKELARHFQHPNLQVFTDRELLRQELLGMDYHGMDLLLMSSGRFDGLDVEELVRQAAGGGIGT